MEASFFGESLSPLYGAFHPAVAIPGARNTGVLLCYPIGQEYMRSHWAFRQLSRQLSRAGHAVFRFDYACTGDSAGDTGEATVNQWVDNIQCAAEELSYSANSKRLAVVGLRFGATLAYLACARGLSCSHLVLWDPVLNGGRYLAELAQLHELFCSDPTRFPRGSPVAGSDAQGRGCELLGSHYSTALYDSIEQLDLFAEQTPDAASVAILDGDCEGPTRLLSSQLVDRGISAHVLKSPDSGHWSSLAYVETALIVHQSLSTIVRSISESFK